MVNANFSWEQVARCFEKIMLAGPRLNGSLVSEDRVHR
jgi:hypothetical protein